MNNGAWEANRQNEVATQQAELRQINRQLARLTALIEALLRSQGWTVTETTIMSPVTIVREGQSPHG